METPQPSQRIALSDSLRHNARRLRQLRRLSVRDLAGRLDDLRSPIAASGVTKLENGSRAVSISDWASLATALNAPIRELVTVPDVDDTRQWAPGVTAEDRAWAQGVLWIELADSVLVHTGEVRGWLAGELMLDVIPTPPWLNRDEFLALTPEARRSEQTFRHPAMIELSILRGALLEVLTGTAADGSAIAVTRNGMADYLTEHAQRMSAYIGLLSSEVRDGSLSGTYMEAGSDAS